MSQVTNGEKMLYNGPCVDSLICLECVAVCKTLAQTNCDSRSEVDLHRLPASAEGSEMMNTCQHSRSHIDDKGVLGGAKHPDQDVEKYFNVNVDYVFSKYMKILYLFKSGRGHQHGQ